MDKPAFLFPGQGAQVVGMGKDLFDAYPRARDVFQRANDQVDFDLADLCFNGPDEKLQMTQYSQPCILAASIAFLEVVKNETRLAAVKPVVCAGLSLGEYTALVYAGSLRFEDAVKLVYRRGRAMAAAGEKHKGSMLSVIGLGEAQIADIVAKASANGIIAAANFNSPEQIVLSGEPAALASADLLAKEAGAKMTVELKVSGAFHSPLMKPAADELAAALAEVEVAKPQTPVISNVTADYVSHPDQVRELLIRQLTSPVKWCPSMQKLMADGVNAFYEIGPGRVLGGLMKRIDRKAGVTSINSADAVKALGE